MQWYMYLIINVIVFSLATLYQRTILKKSRDPVVAYVVSGVIGGLILLSYGLMVGFQIPEISKISLNLILMTVLLGFGSVFNFTALKRVEVSEFTVLFSTRVIWTVAAAILILGESFSSKQFIGAGLIILSVILVSWKKKSMRLSEGEMLTLAGAFFFGIEFVNDAYLSVHTDLFFYMPLIFLLPSIFIGLINFKKMLRINKFLNLKETFNLGLLALMFSVSATSTFMAYQKGHNIAQIAVLNQTSTILIVLLGIIFLKERSHIKLKIIGAIVSLIGVFLVR